MCRSKQTPLRRGFLFQGNANELRTVRPDPHHPGVLSRVFWAGVNMRAAWIVFFQSLFAVLLSVGVVAPSVAQDYYWRNLADQGAYSSPLAACRSTQPNVVHVTIINNGLTAMCNITGGSVGTVYRYGDTCSAGTSYNSQTGECEAPEPDQCATATGEFVHEYNAGSLDPSVPPSLPPTSICESGCLYNRTAKVKGCNRFLEATTGKDLDSVYCQVVYQGAGSQCTTDNPPPGSVFDQPPSKPPADSTPQFTSENKCGDWVTNPDGSQSRSCTSNEQLKEPGQLNCDNAGAYLHCTPGKPAPRFEDTAKAEDTTKTTNPDGSTKTETTTKTDKTVCTDAKPCTSTSAEEKFLSGTNPDGTPGDESKECKGSGCKEGSEGDSEGEEGPERLASAGSCDAGFSCSGDPIDCEVLRQQKEQLCLAEEMTDFPKHKPAIEAAVTGDRFQLDEGSGVIDVPSFINQGTRFLPSACPAAESFSLTTAGGRTFQLSYEPLCRAASDLSGLFVAVATVLAALYVGRGVGGQ